VVRGSNPQSMSHTVRKKTKLLHRVGRIRGQIDAVERALTEEAECGDVLQRIAAARGALDSLMCEVLEDHVQLHILNPSPSVRREAADQLVDIVRSYLK
jgi:DNA-binding FrmR family transcriptional regulator